MSYDLCPLKVLSCSSTLECDLAYMIDIQTGEEKNQMTVMTRNQSIATKDSALLEHLWYLPKGCRFGKENILGNKTITNDPALAAKEPERWYYIDPWV